MKYKLLPIAFLSLFTSFNLSAEGEWKPIPNEYWSCIGSSPSFDISPGGKYLAIMRSPREDVCDIEQDKVKQIEEEWSWRSLTLIDLDTMEAKTLSDGTPGKGISTFRWLSDERYMYSPQRNQTGRNANAYGNVFAVNVDGSERSTISTSKFGQMGYQGISVYNRLDDDPEHALARSNLRRPMVQDFVKLNLFTGKVTKLANGFSPKDVAHRVYDTLTDKDGYPKGAWVDEGIDRVIYTYSRESDEWSEHARFKCHEPFFLPLSYSDKGWLVTGSKFSPSGEVLEYNDTNAVYLYDPETREFGEKLYQDPRYDIGGFTGACRNASGGAAVDYDTRQLEYVYWTSHKPERRFFDDELAQLYGSLDAVFPNDWVSVSTRDKKRTRMVLKVSSSTNPGDYYYYDRSAGTLVPLFTTSPWIDRKLMSPKIPVTYTARDGLEIPAYLTLTKKETKHNYMIMLPHGGPNTKQGVGFDWWVQFFSNKGYNVLQMDFRGSTGLGTNHYVLGNSQWGKTMQDDISDGVYWAIENGYADKDRICIAGASYGGYATMAGLTFTPELYRCGINSVGVVNQEFILEGFSTRSSILNSWEDEAQLEWGNLGTAEGKKYSDETSPVLFVDNIVAPVLVLQGTNDRTVPPEHARQLIRELKKKDKVYMSMFQAKEGHCVKCIGEKATLEYFDIQEEFLKKYLEN
tara:strand:+ start:158 stop:2221 length:2064 start_codon:yes stop_codon:yes gene_type:complete